MCQFHVFIHGRHFWQFQCPEAGLGHVSEKTNWHHEKVTSPEVDQVGAAPGFWLELSIMVSLDCGGKALMKLRGLHSIEMTIVNVSALVMPPFHFVFVPH